MRRGGQGRGESVENMFCPDQSNKVKLIRLILRNFATEYFL